MPTIKLTDVNHAASLLKRIVKKADLNDDGAIRAGDLARIREHNQVGSPTSIDWNNGSDGAELVSGINAAVNRAKSRGGPQLARVATAIDDFKKLAKAADADKNGRLTEAEQKKLKTAGEKSFIRFAHWAKDKKIGDISLPEQQSYAKPKFKWSGTPEQVCQSLLAAHSKDSNDTFLPSWAGTGAARYYLDVTEARAMVKALEPLYESRQKAVLTELAERTHQSEFGCVCPNDPAKAVFEAYAASLGLTLDFQQPGPPGIDPS